MALPIDYFQPETFSQANPFLQGMSAVQDLYAKNLANKIAQVQAQYAQPAAQQELLKSQLSNQILQPQAQYAPQMTQAELALKQAMPGYYGAMSSEAMSKIPLNEEQAKMVAAQIPYAPYQMMGKYYQGLGQYMAHGPSSLAVRMQNNPAFQNFVANNPQAQANYAGLMQSVLNNQVSVPNLPGMPPNVLNASQSSSQTPQQGVPTAYGNVSPSDIGAVTNATQNAFMKTAFTPQQIQQMTYENSAENMLKQALPDLPEVTKFAGLAGHANMTADKYASAFGLKNDPSYSKFVNFSQTQAPIIANELRRAFGGQATDTEREIMDNLANPVYWNKSPQIAMGQMQTLFNTLKANAQAITQPKNVNLAQALGSIGNPLKVPQPQSFNSNQLVTMKAPNGELFKIPAKNLQEALKRGAIQQ